MQISSSNTSQVMSLIRNSALGKANDGQREDTVDSALPSAAAPVSYSSGYTSLQNKLSGLNVGSALDSLNNSDGTVSGIYGFPFSTLSPTMTNSKGQTLGGLVAATRTYNPADWLTDSDKSLFAQVTGSTIEDGVIYKADGTVDNSIESFDFADQLFEIRNDGVSDGYGNRCSVNGDITAEDLQLVMKDYKMAGLTTSSNYMLLEKGVAALS